MFVAGAGFLCRFFLGGGAGFLFCRFSHALHIQKGEQVMVTVMVLGLLG